MQIRANKPPPICDEQNRVPPGWWWRVGLSSNQRNVETMIVDTTRGSVWSIKISVCQSPKLRVTFWSVLLMTIVDTTRGSIWSKQNLKLIASIRHPSWRGCLSFCSDFKWGQLVVLHVERLNQTKHVWSLKNGAKREKKAGMKKWCTINKYQHLFSY